MCAVSAISDYYMRPTTWPMNPYLPTPLAAPVPTLPPVREFSDEDKATLREIIRRLDELDKKLGDQECMDEKKKEFFEAIDYKETE